MSKKKNEEEKPIPSIEETKPVQTRARVDETRPVPVKRKSRAAAVEPQKEKIEGNSPVPEIQPELEKKPRRGKWIWLGILVMILLSAAGSAFGYFSAIQARQAAEQVQRLSIANEQYARALLDEKQGHYLQAQQRLQYVLQIYPNYPEIDSKLVEIGVLVAQSQGDVQLATPLPNETAQPIITAVPTQDTKSVSILFKQAQDQYAAADWSGLYTTVTNLRNIDPTYEPIKVDGMYYAALRNRGISDIQAGYLEVGLYDFALAKQIAPIDADAESYRSWAIMYLDAGSWWSVNWQNAANQFAALYAMVPKLRDSSGITVTERYARALEGYGDYLQQTLAWCDAVPQYQKALSIYTVPGLADKIPQAQEYCANPPPTPTPTVDPHAPTSTPPPPG